MKSRIHWLPAHPAEGSASMDRYWRELEKCFAARKIPPFQIRCPLGRAPARSSTAGRFRRAFCRYVAYPLRVRMTVRSGVIHILDHSSAHLLPHVPRAVFKIATVHDLAPLEDPTGLTPAQLARFRKTASCLNDADLLLSDSAYTARALEKFLEKKLQISVLPLGVDAADYALPRTLEISRPLPACPKILSIGASIGRKNLRVLPEIMSRVIAENGPAALIRVGGRLSGELLAALQGVMPAEHIVELGALSEDQLIALYQRMDALVFPSTLEGFGLPVLEAMAAGCPVVCSNASSLPEVGGEAALYFDPGDPAAAAAQINRLLRQTDLRTQLVHQGRARAAELSWDVHAEKLSEHYQSAIVAGKNRP